MSRATTLTQTIKDTKVKWKSNANKPRVIRLKILEFSSKIKFLNEYAVDYKAINLIYSLVNEVKKLISFKM